VQYACQVGNVPLLKLFYPHHKLPWESDDDEYLVRGRSVEVVTYLSGLEAPIFAPQTMDTAARTNCLPIVEWLHFHRNEGCSTDAMDYAAANDHLLNFWRTNRPKICTTFAMDHASASGYAEVVQFLHQIRTEACTTNAMDYAGSSGHLEIVQFLHMHRTEGYFQFLHDNRTEDFTSDAMVYAAGNGHLEIVQFLYEHRTEGCLVKAMAGAVTNDRLEVVEWLNANRY
ncbi:hypothetical protein As57867_006838, partial [Aphanomyces stellatus]